MGNMCDGSERQKDNETSDSSKPSLEWETTLSPNLTASLYHGHYRQHQSDALLVFTEARNVHCCEPVKEYATNSSSALERIAEGGEGLHRVGVVRGCPYRQVLVMVLPAYHSDKRQNYVSGIEDDLERVLGYSRDLTVELGGMVSGINSIPNQIVLSILVEWLSTKQERISLSMIATGRKMLNLYRWELIKAEHNQAEAI